MTHVQELAWHDLSVMLAYLVGFGQCWLAHELAKRWAYRRAK